MPLVRNSFVAALSTALISCTLLLLAVLNGWLGPDIGRGAQFCEAARDGLLKQPANSLSNAGFVVVGLLIGWQARAGTVLPRLPGVATALACVVVLLGPASAAMHATQSDLGGRLDLFSMYLVAGFAAACALTRWWDGSVRMFWGLFVGAVLGCEAIALIDVEIPVVQFSGNLAFAALLLTASVLEVRLWRRGVGSRSQIGWGVAAIGSMLLAFAIWNLAQGPWCDPDSLIQGHGVWHLLCALAAWFLFALYRSEIPSEMSSEMPSEVPVV